MADKRRMVQLVLECGHKAARHASNGEWRPGHGIYCLWCGEKGAASKVVEVKELQP